MTELSTHAYPPARAGWCIALIVLATVAGAALRIHQLDRPSFWHDELMTIRDIADPSRKHVMRWLGYAPTAIGLAMRGVDLSAVQSDRPDLWRSQGVSESAARSGACLVGCLSIVILALAARAIFSWRTCAVLAVLLAAGTWHIYWSQTARFYGLVMMLVALSLMTYYHATRPSPGARGWGAKISLVLAVVFLTLAFWAHWSALLIAPLAIADYLLGWWRREPVNLGALGWSLGLLGGTAAGAFLFYLYLYSPGAFSTLNMDGHSPVKLAAGTLYMVGLPVAMMALLGAWLLWREQPRLALYLSLAAVMPVACLSAIALLGGYAHVRYAYISSFGFFALASVGIAKLYESLRDRVGALAAWSPLWLLLASMAYADGVYFTSGGGYHPRWREAFALVAAQRQDDDLVFCDGPQGYLSAYYLQTPRVEKQFPPNAEALKQLRQRAFFVAVTQTATFGRMHGWLHDAADLQATFPLHLHQPYAQVSVYRYQPPPTLPDAATRP